MRPAKASESMKQSPLPVDVCRLDNSDPVLNGLIGIGSSFVERLRSGVRLNRTTG
jgi:hypothetical protein